MSYLLHRRKAFRAGDNPGTANLENWWSFDEASGTLADSHGSNDGTASGATYGATGKINDCMDFDGVNDYVAADYSIQGDGSFSICAWIYAHDNTDRYILTVCEAPTSSTSDRHLYINSSSLLEGYIYDGAAKTVTGSTPVTANAWHHVALVCDGSTMKVYLDGTEDGSTSAGNAYAGYTSAEITFGDYRGLNFDGLIDEPSVWSKALSAAEVAWLYNSGSGRAYSDLLAAGQPGRANLVSWWACDNASGTLTDSHASNDLATISADPPAYSETGKVSNAIKFISANSEYASTGSAVRSTYPLSITGWAKVTTGSTDFFPFAIADASVGTHYFAIQLSVGNYAVYYFRGGGSEWITGGSISVNTWYHFAAVSSASNDHELYIDGALVAGPSSTSSTPAGLDVTSIGAIRDSTPSYGDGTADEIAVWSAALTAAEVSWLYTEEAGYSDL